MCRNRTVVRGEETDENSGYSRGRVLQKEHSNIDADELALYSIVVIFASAHLFLIVRYFLRLRVYFKKLQKEIRKQIEQYHNV